MKNDSQLITILFFAQFRERLGTARLELELPDDGALSTVERIRCLLIEQGPVWAECLGGHQRRMMAVNQVMASDETAVKPGDEVAFFPPVTGG